jgi:hypothetical protein
MGAEANPMQSAMHVTTMILPGGRIEIAAPELPEGQRVDVIVLFSEPSPSAGRSVIDILALAPGHRLFKTAAEVDAYVREERDSWDR